VVVVVVHLDGVVHGVEVAEEVEVVAVEVVVEAVDVAGASKRLDKQTTIHCDLAMGVGNHIWEAYKHRATPINFATQN
jgi:hypothetical protein